MSDDTTIETVDGSRAADVLASASENPELPPLAPPASFPDLDGYDEETASLGAEDQARLAANAIGASGDLDLYGYFTSGVSELAIASTTGLRASQRTTDATCLALAADEGASGDAERTAWRVGDIDPAEVTEEAVAKASRTRGAQEIGPDRYRAVLEPYALAELLYYFSFDSLNGLALLEERSFFAGRIGERAFDPGLGASPGPAGFRLSVGRGPLAVAVMAAAGASLLHPWEGPTLIVIFAGLALWRRGRDMLSLAVPAIGAALPLGYYYLLSHTDAAWRLASHNEAIGRLSPLTLLVGLGPLALLMLGGIERPRGVVIEQMLLLWILASFVTYFANDAFAPHALQGLSLPFTVLAVRAWRRVRLPAILGAVAIALLTIPGLAYDGRKFVRVARSSIVQYYLTNSDARALDWVSAKAPPGGVLAPTPFAIDVPSQTGRRVWVGHGYWSQDYGPRSRAADRLFDGRLQPAAAVRFVHQTGAALLVSDCQHLASLTRALRPLLRSIHGFGCARVYVLRDQPAGRSRTR